MSIYLKAANIINESPNIIDDRYYFACIAISFNKMPGYPYRTAYEELMGPKYYKSKKYEKHGWFGNPDNPEHQNQRVISLLLMHEIVTNKGS